MPGTRKLGRATANRMAMLRAMVTFLLENGKIETTVTRAKEVRSLAEKMITIAKEPTLHNKRQVFAFVTKECGVRPCCVGLLAVTHLHWCVAETKKSLPEHRVGSLIARFSYR